MKTPKLLKKVQEYVDSDKKQQCEQRDSIKKILNKLKKKQKALRVKRDQEKDEKARAKIQKELDIIFVQRKKGLKILKKMKKPC